MGRLTKQEHAVRAVSGIVAAIGFSIAGAIMNYGQHGPFKATKLTWIFVPVLPFLAWGCSHLARHRGYSTGVSYGLIVLVMVGSAISVPAVSGSTAGIVVGAASIIPPAILMTLNVRPGNFRSSREKKP